MLFKCCKCNAPPERVSAVFSRANGDYYARAWCHGETDHIDLKAETVDMAGPFATYPMFYGGKDNLPTTAARDKVDHGLG